MEKYQILDSEITKYNIKYVATIEGEKVELKFADVRAGLAWATDKSPLYWCILAQPWIDTEVYAAKVPSYELIKEYMYPGLSIDDKFNSMADDSILYRCDFFADLCPAYEDEAESYWDFRSDRGYQDGGLVAAPYANSFRIGVELIKSWVKSYKLDIMENSEAFDQLSKITESDLADPKVKENFFAIEALRHVASSFKRDPVVQQPQPEIPRNYPPHSQGWMF
jgi:hypothetical protein